MHGDAVEPLEPLVAYEPGRDASLQAPKPALRLRLVGAKGLRKADPGVFAKSDPYCVAEISGHRWATPIRKRTLNPEWNFSIETTEYELGDWIEFSVYDHDIASKDDLLGKYSMSCAEWGYPAGFSGEVVLTDPKCPRSTATLTVEIEPLPKWPPPGCRIPRRRDLPEPVADEQAAKASAPATLTLPVLEDPVMADTTLAMSETQLIGKNDAGAEKRDCSTWPWVICCVV